LDGSNSSHASSRVVPLVLGIHLNTTGQGWAVGRFGLILHTENGGRAWTPQQSRTSSPLTAVSFANDHAGFTVGGSGTILTTSNGGTVWQQRHSGTEEHLLSVYALSSSSAFVVGAFGTLLSTTDGGQTWIEHSLSWHELIPRVVDKVGYLQPHLNAVYFYDWTTGWIGGEFGAILHTRDAGRTWAPQRHGPDLPPIEGLAFRDRRKGYAVGQQGTALTTTNGGSSWRNTDAGTAEDLFALALGSKVAVAAGDGVLLRVEPGESKWEPVSGFSENRWLSDVAVGESAVVAVGQAGVIHKKALD